MTFKNGTKEYLLTGVLFGIPMCLLLSLYTLNIIIGIVLGILSGLLFTFLIFLFSKFMENKFAKIRLEISKDRKVICDGAATMHGNGGWLFLTEFGLEFYPHKINMSTKEIKIPLNMIRTVNTHKNQIILKTTNTELAILTAKNKEWEKQIKAALNSWIQ